MLPVVVKRPHFRTTALDIHSVSVPKYVLRKWAGKEGREGRREEGREERERKEGRKNERKGMERERGNKT